MLPNNLSFKFHLNPEPIFLFEQNQTIYNYFRCITGIKLMSLFIFKDYFVRKL